MSLRLDDQLCFALYSATRAVTQAYAPLLAPLGLTYPQYLVMLVLWESDGRSVGELGERLALDSGTLTPLLKRLAAQGLLTRERSSRDERVVEVRLTPEGRLLRARAEDVPRQLLCTLATALPLDEVVPMREALRTLADRVRAATAAKTEDP